MSLKPEGPLKGIRVIAMEQMILGPECTQFLADEGAEVIKIESPGLGDAVRFLPPHVETSQGPVGDYYLRFNRNKKSVAINLKTPAGREILEDLIKKGDVIVENFAPEVMKGFGINYEYARKINPSIIYAAASGFGRMESYTGPYSNLPAYDAVAQAMGGFMYVNREPGGRPIWPGMMLGDRYPALMMAYAVMTALYNRLKTGEGQFIDIAMYDCIAYLTNRSFTYYMLTGRVLGQNNNPTTSVAPYDTYKAEEGHIVITVLNEPQWAKLCEAIGRRDLIDDPQFNSGIKRGAVKEEVIRPLIEEWLKDKTRMEACEILWRHGVPAGPVQSAADIENCPQIQKRDLIWEVKDEKTERLKFIGNPIKTSNAADKKEFTRPPRLGEHTKEVLNSLLGYTPEKIDRLKNEGAISLG